jgi:hypothetical protein
MTLETIATVTFPAKQIVQEGSWGSRGLGKHASTMTLYLEEGALFIEWDFPSLETTENIGLEIEWSRKRIVGYDGVMSFPRPAVKWLRSLGYVIAKDVI